MYTMVMLLSLTTGAAAPAFTHGGCGGCGGWGHGCGGWSNGCVGRSGFCGSGFCGRMFSHGCGGCGGWNNGCGGWNNGCSGWNNGCGGCGGYRHGFCGSGFCGRLFNHGCGGCAGWNNGCSGWNNGCSGWNNGCTGWNNGGCGGVIYTTVPAGTPVAPPVTAPAGDSKPMPTDTKPSDKKAPETTAKVIVNVPADAKLFIEGVAMTSTGAVRHFESPALVPGKLYTYTLKAEVVRDGKAVTTSRTVDVQAGQTVSTSLEVPVTVAAK